MTTFIYCSLRLSRAFFFLFNYFFRKTRLVGTNKDESRNVKYK